jgi:hypothetical protein
MPSYRSLRTLVVILCFATCTIPGRAERMPAPLVDGTWRAVMMLRVSTGKELANASAHVPKLAAMGMNVLVFHVPDRRPTEDGSEEADYTREEARAFAQLCREHDVLLVPHWNAKRIVASPKAEWREQARLGLERIDEVVDLFAARAVHVGLDEVFVTGAEFDPDVQGDDPAKPFIETILALHEHIVGKRGLTMLMWGDRLIDARDFDYKGPCQADAIGLARVIDRVPRDIIICPWHYFRRTEYPSLPMFIEQGFRVLPSSHAKIVGRDPSGKRLYHAFKSVDAPMALLHYADRLKNPAIIGHLFTTWSVRPGELCEYEPLVYGLPYLLEREEP